MSPRRPRNPSALGAFLRGRRDRLTPQEVGLPPGVGLRRTAGLRREELAALAGISVDYYIRLERGSEQRPSPGVVAALARALRLDEAEHQHLRELAGQCDRNDLLERLGTSTAPEGIHRILDALRPLPGFVTNRIGDLIAWNGSGIGLLHGIQDWPDRRRNVHRFAFLHPGARTLYADWEAEVTGLASGLRRLAATEPDADDLQRLIAELRRDSRDFERLFDRYDIEHYDQGRLHLQHPVVGDIAPAYQVMRLDGTGGLTMMAFHAAPGSREEAAFRSLDPGRARQD